MNRMATAVFSLLVHLTALGVVFLAAPSSSSADQMVNEDWKVARELTLKSSKARLDQLFTGELTFHGIEVITAASSDAAFYSRWGHSMLRFVDSADDPMNDLVLSFVADVDESRLKVTKGVFGGYKVLAMISEFRTVLATYANLEERALVREIVPTSVETRERLLITLQRWTGSTTATHLSYTFLENNCAGVLSKLLEDSGIIPVEAAASVPTRMGRKFRRNGLTLLPPITVPSWNQRFSEISRALGVDLANEKVVAAEIKSIENRIPLLRLDDQIFLYLEAPELLSPVRQALVGLIKAGKVNRSVRLSDVYRVDSPPAPLYSLCPSDENQEFCLEEKLQFAVHYWGHEVLEVRFAGLVKRFCDRNRIPRSLRDVPAALESIKALCR